MVNLFERPLPSGWAYPCSIQDLEEQLQRLPQEDLEGLWAVGLAPATRKDNAANGRYYFRKKPFIHLYSYPDTLAYRLVPHTKWSDIEQWLWVELEYGMRYEQAGSRWRCQWEAEDLRRFTLEHVLVHEVGHHVYCRRRQKQGLVSRPRTRESEQFAEDYAIRLCRGGSS